MEQPHEAYVPKGEEKMEQPHKAQVPKGEEKNEQPHEANFASKSSPLPGGCYSGGASTGQQVTRLRGAFRTYTVPN